VIQHPFAVYLGLADDITCNLLGLVYYCWRCWHDCFCFTFDMV